MRDTFRRNTSFDFFVSHLRNFGFPLFVIISLVLIAPGSAPIQAQTAPASTTAVEAVQTGILEIVSQDYQQQSVTKYYLNTGQKRIELSGVPSNLRTGARIRLQGGVIEPATGNAQMSEPSPVGSPATAAGPAISTGQQSIAVLLLNFVDDTSQPFTASDVQDVVFNQTDAFYRENSQNQTWLTGEVFGYFTLPISAASCNILGIADDADQAALAAGINVANYGHVLYVISEPGCDFDGAAYLGGTRMWSDTQPIQMRVVAHELGHNLGLYHAHALNCSPNIIGTNCTSVEYGDLFEVMGDTTGSDFNAYHKEQLGYLNASTSQKIATVQSAGTYDIEPYEDTSNPNGVKALKILKQTDAQTGTHTYYYVEYRQPIGFDAPLAQLYPAAVNGVLIHTGADQNTNSSFLLDMNPQTAVFDDAALAFGKKFVDTSSGITITALSGDATVAHVKVDFTANVCNQAAPVVNISPSAQSGLPGSELDYTVTITNADTSGCDPETFALANSAVPNWTATLSDSSFTLAPGATATTTLKVTSPASAASGAYKMYVKATGNTSGFVGFAQLTYSISVSLTLSADSSSVVIAQGNGGSLTLSTTIGGGFNSPVTISLTGIPAGVTASPSQTTIAAPGAGKSILTFIVPSGTPVGTYTLNASATGGGLTSQIQINLIVTSGGDFALAAAPTQVNIVQGGSGNSTVSSTLTGVFNSAIPLSISALPAGVTSSFVPPTLPAPGSGKSILTFNASATAAAGTYALTITGTSGAITHSIPVTLVIGAVVPPNPGPWVAISQSGWKLKYADSQELNCALFPATFAFDGKASTFWQTQSCVGTSPLPHEIQIDLGASYPIGGFQYQPRKDGSSVGKIGSFEFYVSADGNNWGTAAATGTLISSPSDVSQKQVVFNTVVTGRYIRLRALSEVNGGQVTTAAEINVLQASTSPPPPVGDFSLSANPASLTIVQGGTGSTMVNSTLTGSFSAAITLSLAGAPAGVTPTFSPTTIAAPGSGISSLTLNVSSTVAPGIYSLTIGGQAGAVSHSAGLTLTVTSNSPPVVVPTAIPQTGWKLKFADSQELTCGLFPATFSFDGKPQTMWQTQNCVGTSALPHEIQIDLGASYSIKGFRYLPRQDGKTAGKIAAFEVYVSPDGMSWGTPAATGTLITDPTDAAEKQVLFNAPVVGRYVRLRALSEASGLQVITVAELNVLQ